MEWCGEEKEERSGWDLAGSIFVSLLGVWIIFGRGSAALVAILPFIFAIGVLLSSVMHIVGSVNLKSHGAPRWGWMLAFGIIGSVFGLLLLFMPGVSAAVVAYLIAGMMIAYGIKNILMYFLMKKLGDYVHEKMQPQN